MRAVHALDAYVAELGRRGLSAHTVRGYRTDLSRLVECGGQAGGVLDESVIVAFLAQQSGAAATQARRRSALRGFVRWAQARGVLTGVTAGSLTSAVGPRHSTVVPYTPAVTPPRGAVEAVLAAIPRQADRDQLLFGLLARLGLRPGEALALGVEDFDEAAECLHVPGWGGVRRRVLVDDPQILMRLVNYKRASGRARGPLFTARGRATPLRYQSVLARWNRYTQAAGVDLKLADLRRAHAEELIAGGVPEAVVRARLGQRTGPLTGAAASPSAPDSDEAIRAWRSGRDTAHAGDGPDRARHAG